MRMKLTHLEDRGNPRWWMERRMRDLFSFDYLNSKNIPTSMERKTRKRKKRSRRDREKGVRNKKG